MKIRVAIGFASLIFGFVFVNWWFLLGWAPVATGLLEFCPLYSIFGISTMKIQKKFWA